MKYATKAETAMKLNRIKQKIMENKDEDSRAKNYADERGDAAAATS